MHQEVLDHIEEAKMLMDESVDHLERELVKIRAGKASPSMLNGVMVDYYGTSTPINQVANISSSDSKTLNISPWEKSLIATIEQAIFAANLGLTPQNNGEMIIINIPPLTEERRKELVKQAKSLGEEAKVSIRNARHKIMDFIKKAVKDGYPEDAGKRQEESVEKITTSFGEKVNSVIEKKQNDIMTI
ncbi:MAG: ribosome recycling factor [Saprospiraceae bacterium]|nr:ribosome recycling factor [Saprospiraceae bacterium]